MTIKDIRWSENANFPPSSDGIYMYVWGKKLGSHILVYSLKKKNQVTHWNLSPSLLVPPPCSSYSLKYCNNSSFPAFSDILGLLFDDQKYYVNDYILCLFLLRFQNWKVVIAFKIKCQTVSEFS